MPVLGGCSAPRDRMDGVDGVFENAARIPMGLAILARVVIVIVVLLILLFK